MESEREPTQTMGETIKAVPCVCDCVCVSAIASGRALLGKVQEETGFTIMFYRGLQNVFLMVTIITITTKNCNF